MKRTLCGLLLLLLPCAAAYAETAYVIDQLLVGVHKDKALNSAIIKVYPTGTELQVLKRDKDLAQIKGPDGTTGWVDAGYLMKDKPASMRLDELQRQNTELKAELEAQKDKAAEATPAQAAGANAAVQHLQRANAQLKQQLATERLNVGELQAKVADLTRSAGSSDGANAASLAQLRKENGALQAQIGALRSHGAASGTGLRARLLSWLELDRMQLIGLGVLLLLAFLAGIYCMDALYRRKHGGFRV